MVCFTMYNIKAAKWICESLSCIENKFEKAIPKGRIHEKKKIDVAGIKHPKSMAEF